MTDRELLELAAKSYWGEEIDDVCSIRWLDADQCIVFMHCDNQDHDGQDVEWLWNPLVDDGAALRLAIKLRFAIQPISVTTVSIIKCPLLVEIWRNGDLVKECYSDTLDIYELTRRAIVRAAAEIGKQLP